MIWARRNEKGEFRQSIVTDFPARCAAERRPAANAPAHVVLIPLHRWASFGQPYVSKPHLKLA